MRLGVTGASSGGGASFLALTSYPKRPVPPDRIFRGLVLLYPGLTSGLCAGLEPTAEAPMRVPLLIIAGDRDRFGRPAKCLSVADMVNKFGGTAEFRLYEGATHGFDNPNAGTGPGGGDLHHPDLTRRLHIEIVAFFRSAGVLPK
jgi:dienelactone hydrolase